jgi:energy-coupling factor transport system substrate-specific component
MTPDPATGLDPAPTATPALAADPVPRAVPVSAPPTALVVTVIPLAVAVNFVASALIGLLGVPIYLDTTGTFLAAVLLGPWWGALAGVMTNALGVLLFGPTNLLFAPVNVAAALIWGYGIRRFRLGRAALPFFLLAALVGVVTACLATPIVEALGGATGHPSDAITAALASVAGITAALLASNIATSVPDKVISAYLGLAITAALPAVVAARVVLPAPSGPRRVAIAAVGIVAGIVVGAVLVALTAVLFRPS